MTMRTLSTYRVDVACLSEVRLPGSGHTTIKVPHSDAQDWMTIGIDWAQDRGAWATAVRDAVAVMDAGATAPRLVSKKALLGYTDP